MINRILLALVALSPVVAFAQVQPPGLTLPSQSGQAGNFLSTNGTTTNWATVPSASAIANNTLLGNTSGSSAVASALTALPGAFSTVTPGTLTGQFYSELGSRSWSITDRLMVGGAALSNQKFTGFSGVPTWVYPSYLFRDAQFGVIQTFGLWGISAATRASDYTGGLQQSTGAAGLFTLNDGGRGATRTLYIEANNINSSASAVSGAAEIILKDTGGITNVLTPYGGSAFGSSAFNFKCGGDPSYGPIANTNCNYGLYIAQSNSATVQFQKGIVFGSSALVGATGVNGGGNAGQAIEMGYGQGLHWFSSNGSVQAGRISSIGTSSADQSHDMQFVNNGVQFVNNSSTNTFAMTHVTSGQNGVVVTDAVNGAGPSIGPATGDSEASVDLNLSTIGSGLVKVNGVAPFPSIPAAATFSASGCSNSTLVGGGSSINRMAAGSFKAGVSGTCTVVLTLPTAAHSWACSASDITGQIPFVQTAQSATTCTVSAVTATNDIVTFIGVGY